MKTVIYVLAMLLVAAPLSARQVPQRLTLEDAIRIAEAQSPDYRRALRTLERAEIRERTSFRTTFLPQINPRLNFRGTTYRSVTRYNFDETLLPEPLINSGRSSSSNQSLNVSMTLFSGQSIFEYRRSKIEAEQAATQFDTNTRDLRAEVTRLFFAAIQADAAVAVEERLLERAVANLALVEKRFRAGNSQLEDLLGARLQQAQSEHDLESARGNAYKARLALMRAIGIDGDPEFELIGELPEPFDPSLLDIDDLVRSALATSPRIRQAENSLRFSEASARATGALRWPTLYVSGDLRRERATRNYDAIFELNPRDWSYNVALGLSVPIPLFQFQQDASIALARLDVEDARANLESERRAVEIEVRSVYVDLRVAYNNARMAEQQAELQRERAALMELRFEAGIPIDFMQLEQAWDQAAQAERQVLAARINFQNTLMALEQLLGREVRP